MKNSNLLKLYLIVGIIMIVLGVSYGFFSYNKVGSNNIMTTGSIYMNFVDNDTINLIGIFPESIETARLKDDNYVTFTISGENTSNKDLYYEVDLIHGDEKNEFISFSDKDLRFDLLEIIDGTETFIRENVSFDEINNSKIWVDTIDGGTVDYNKTFKLRMWLDENVLISDTDNNASYSASNYKNHYASIKISVTGDFDEKYLYDTDDTLLSTNTN